MNWLWQGLISAFVCYVIREIWEKLKCSINSDYPQKSSNNPNNFSSLKNIKVQLSSSIVMILLPLIILIFLKEYCLSNQIIMCLMFMSLFWGIMLFWGEIEAMLNEIIYYRKQNSPTNKHNNK